MTRILGIDPGLKGGIALLDTQEAPQAWKMPAMEADLWAIIIGAHADVAFIEKVSSSPQMGVTSAFTFGRGYGSLVMALTASGVPFTEVRPQQWQSPVGLVYPKGSKPTEKKNLGKRRAQQLFPMLDITLSISDALLIARYGELYP
jgi:Holliday junction resolvasome RuvABC endonuclease subunit